MELRARRPNFFRTLFSRERVRTESGDLQRLRARGLRNHQLHPEIGHVPVSFLSLVGESDFGLRPSIGKATPIATLGSCYSRFIKKEFLQRGFHHVQTEADRFSDHASCGWERVYTTANAVQTLRYTVAGHVQAERFVKVDGRVRDLWRHKVDFESEAQAFSETERHVDASRRAIEQAEILFYTVGQNEAWLHRENGFWLAQAPSDTLSKASNTVYELRRLSVDDNLKNLVQFAELARQINPKIALLICIAPIPAMATFFDENVILRSSNNKAIMKVAVAQFIEQHSDLAGYFPAYEVTQIWKDFAYEEDNRHPRPEVISATVDLFQSLYFKRHMDT